MPNFFQFFPGFFFRFHLFWLFFFFLHISENLFPPPQSFPPVWIAFLSILSFIALIFLPPICSPNFFIKSIYFLFSLYSPPALIRSSCPSISLPPLNLCWLHLFSFSFLFKITPFFFFFSHLPHFPFFLLLFSCFPATLPSSSSAKDPTDFTPPSSSSLHWCSASLTKHLTKWRRA